MSTAGKSIRVLISGRVQGVGYRAWCERTASALGLSGWVRNRRSGEVEAVFSGPADTVAEMLRRTHEGPRFAHVVTVETVSGNDPVSGPFEVRETL